MSEDGGTAATAPSRIRHFIYALSTLVGALLVALGLFLSRIDRGTDFQIFYDSAVALRSHDPIYLARRPNLNPPAVVAAYVPLTYLSLRNALTAFTVIGMTCVVAATLLIVGVAPLVPWYVLASLIFATEGGWTNVWLGQEGLILMLATTLAWRFDRERRDAAAGMWSGMAIYAKPFLAGLLIYWFWRRQWRSLVAAIATCAVLIVAGALAAGPSSYVAWWRTLGNGPAPYSPLNASLLGLWSRLFFGSEFAPPLIRQPPRVMLPIAALSIVALVVLIYARLRADRSADRGWALILLGSLLASPLGWIYYLPLAAGPVLASLSGTVSWACFWIATNLLLIFRSNILVSLYWSPRGVMGVGSIYAWVLILLFAAVWIAPNRLRTSD